MLAGLAPIAFRENALEALRTFPEAARRRAGYQLDRVQHGLEPSDWRPLSKVGTGTREIRIRDDQAAFRILCVARFAKTVYVPRCFRKKTQRTAADIEMASRRGRETEKELDR